MKIFDGNEIKEKKKVKATRSVKLIKKPSKKNNSKSNNNLIKGQNDKPREYPKTHGLKILPIGGLKEIGKNMTLFEYEDDILILDCGMSFPDEGMHGIDVVIPDFSYVLENKKKIKGIIFTHGHEDHIGAVPYLFKQASFPLYATHLTKGLIENKFVEHGIKKEITPIKVGQKVRVGKFVIDPIRITHSIADSLCFEIKTPEHTVFHTGDFKIDYTPIDGEPIDLAKLAMLGAKGVDILLADSTNATRSGFTDSEQKVGQTMERIFRSSKNSRMIIATFASNVHRVQKIIDNAVLFKRKVAISGRSMVNVASIAQKLGYLKVPEGIIIELNEIHNFPKNKVVIITTGSQGEPMSALARMANSEHRDIEIENGDVVVLSSTPVPGNEKAVSGVVDKLFEKGANVIYSDIADIHVSGHACQEELKLMHSLIKPKHFIPVHGEYRHLKAHAELAESLGLKKDKIHIIDNGDALVYNKGKVHIYKDYASAEDIYVDGLGIGDVGNIVIKERQKLATSGLILVAITFDKKTKKILAGPNLMSKGFIYVKENEELMNDMRREAKKLVPLLYDPSNEDLSALKDNIIRKLGSYIYTRTKRNPVIIPVFMHS